MAVSLPVYEVTTSILCFLYCALKDVQGFHPSFEI